MPKYRAVVLAAACALALAAPASAAYAASAHHAAAKPVLTIKKKGGPAVKKGAVLKASLAKGKRVVLTITSSALGGTLTATCKSSTLKAKVTANPASRGKARLSLTGETIRRCTVKGAPAGVTVGLSLKALKLPYRVTVSSAKGFPVTIAGRSSRNPLSLQATITVTGLSTPLTCVYTAPKVNGHASNTGNKVSFAKQKLTLAKSQPSECSLAPSGTFSATYGPIRDTSVRHSPKVFFNRS